MELFKQIELYTQQNRLIKSGDSLLVAVSGGADSVFLLYFLRHLQSKLKLKLAVAHFNHGLRGLAANQDEAFVRNLASKFKLSYFSAKTSSISKLSGTEVAARKYRYDFLTSTTREHNIKTLVTAHHQDDQVETVLMRICRKAGVKGLAGINPKSTMQGVTLIRPLLNTPKTAIIGYLKSHHIAWREDTSNLQPIYTRNRVRLKVLPHLKQVDPAIETKLLLLASRAKDTHIHEQKQARVQLASISCGPNAITLNKYQQLSAPQRLGALRSFLQKAKAELGHSQLAQLDHAICTTQTFQTNLPTGLLLRSEYGKIRLLKKLPAAIRPTVFSGYSAKQVPGLGLVSLRLVKNSEGKHIRPEPDQLWLDAALVKLPLTVRAPLPGDYFVPFGMLGRKKLQDYFTDTKVSSTARQSTPVFADATGAIVAVFDRASELYKVTKSTSNILKIKTTKVKRGS